MMPRVRFFKFAAILAAVLSAGCDDESPTAPTLPPVINETFSGTLTPSGGVTHGFLVTRSGQVTATLTALNADNLSLQVGLTLGILNAGNGQCQAVITNDHAFVTTQLVGQASASATLCVRIYDVGALADNQTYEIAVAHF